MIIIDSNTNQLNVSRIWKSILKTDNIHHKLNKFLKTINIKRYIDRYNIKIERKSYKNKPLLNGFYGPIVFIHLILYYLNAKYLLEVATMLTDMILNRKNQNRNKYELF